MSWSYPLASTTWDSLEYQAIQRVIDSGQFSMGKEVQNFEAAYAKWVGSKYCVMCSSGSTANLLMVAALFYKKDQPLKRGDEVIVRTPRGPEVLEIVDISYPERPDGVSAR